LTVTGGRLTRDDKEYDDDDDDDDDDEYDMIG